MKKLFTFLTLVCLPFMVMASSDMPNQTVTTDLQQQMNEAGPADLIRINIRLTEQYDLETFAHLRQTMSREQRRQFVVNELKAFATQSQQSLLDELSTLQLSGEVTAITPLWIANVINLYATPSAIEQLAYRTDIARIDHDEERIVIDPIDVQDVTEEQLREITYNVSIMNVPEVWDMGFFGDDVVVAVLDTGVNYNHNDLVNNMWTHPDFPNHGWDFTGNNNDPMDLHGHGTHCAGTVAGDGSSGSQTGMAPNAKIMALQVLTASGGGTESGVWQAIEFSVEYGAHVMSLSLGWAHAWGPDRASWRTTMDNALAAGVVAAVAAGNEGNQQWQYPIPSNVRTPGDCPAPWRHPDQPDTGTRSAVVTVGATDQNDQIAGFSSRGPVTWQNVSPYNDYPYNPGEGLILPDVVAPGVNVKSLSHSSNSGYTTMSGTSMATPGVAGVMALILSKNPGITPEEMSQVLEETALPLSANKSTTFGSGRVDALEAIENTAFPGPVYAHHTINDETGNNNGQVNPGEFIQVHLALANNSDATFENVEAYVYTDSPYVTMTDSIAFFGDFGPEETIEIENAIAFEVADNIPGSHQIIFNIESSDGEEIWKSNFAAIAGAPRLVITGMTIDDSSGNDNGQLDPGEEVVAIFNTFNAGQLTAHQPVATLTTDSPYLSIEENNFTLNDLAPWGSTSVSFPISVSEATPIAEAVRLTLTLAYEAYIIEKHYDLRVSGLIEDFETGDFSQFDWEFYGNLPWTITNNNVYDGDFSARSGSISHSQVSGMSITVEVARDDSIKFMYKVSSEEGYDRLRFFIGSLAVGQWWGETGWQKASYPVDVGTHTFRWEYVKDGAVSHGSDAAWVDNIVFPQPTTTTAFAGKDAYICIGQDFELEAIVMNEADISWETSGDGSFSDTSVANPLYTPGEADIDNGSVELSLTVIGLDDEVKTDMMTLNISPPVDAFAGDDLIICLGSTLHITSAYAENHESIEWLTAGSGEFDSYNSLETNYIPSNEDYEAGEVVLTMIAAGYGQCDDVHSSFTLYFSPEPTVLAGDDQQICSNLPVELTAQAEHITGLMWTSSGNGSFEQAEEAETLYYPSEDDIANGSVQLSITAYGVEGCQDVSDDIIISFILAPALALSGNMDICPGETAEITLHLSGTAPWHIDMGEGFETIITENSEYLLELQPTETTDYVVYMLLDESGCPVEDAAAFTITVMDVPAAPTMPQGDDVVDYVSVTTSQYTVAEVENAAAYIWSLDPSEAGTISADGVNAQIDWNTDYIGMVDLSVKATGPCGESAFSEALTIELKNTTSISELIGLEKLSIFPNPSDGNLQLSLHLIETQELIILVSNQLGQNVFALSETFTTGKSTKQIDISHLDKGVYLMTIEGKQGSVVRKLVINN